MNEAVRNDGDGGLLEANGTRGRDDEEPRERNGTPGERSGAKRTGEGHEKARNERRWRREEAETKKKRKKGKRDTSTRGRRCSHAWKRWRARAMEGSAGDRKDPRRWTNHRTRRYQTAKTRDVDRDKHAWLRSTSKLRGSETRKGRWKGWSRRADVRMRSSRVQAREFHGGAPSFAAGVTTTDDVDTVTGLEK